MAVGVNGTGKTTTIGKLAWHLREELGKSVLLAAADTFRAAAGEQLEGWAQRAGVEIVGGEPGSDPGAVAFEAIGQARAKGIDVVIVDTAGRLHTQDDLMGELEKVTRVIGRQLEGAPHETLLTIDATTGQNGLRQARLFAETGRRHRRRAHEARRHRARRHRAGDRARAGAAREADRDRRVGRGPAALRRAGIRACADRRELTSLHRVDSVAHRGRRRSEWGRCTRAASTCCRSRSARRSRRSSACSASSALLAAIVFVAISAIVVLALRPVAQRHRRLPPPIRTGAAALVGRTAMVLERIANDEGVGCVRIDGEVWTARTFDDDEVIEAGQKVQVVEIRGATALVMP